MSNKKAPKFNIPKEGAVERKVPTKEEFDRANKETASLFDGLGDVSRSFMAKFSVVEQLDRFEILPQVDPDFRAYIFFKTDADVRNVEATVLLSEMRDFIFTELERVGRGNREDISVDFEIDSLENVKRNFGGNYFLRMR